MYAVRDGDGLVLVDSGWALGGARELLEQAVKVLGCSLAGVRRFLVTHVHRGHYTLAVTLRREFGMRISLGRGEAGTLRVARDPGLNPWTGLISQLCRGGADGLVRELQGVPSLHDPADWADPDDWLGAPDDIEMEAGTWQVHATPGHTRGQTLAHLDVLAVAGRLRRTDRDGACYYVRA